MEITGNLLYMWMQMNRKPSLECSYWWGGSYRDWDCIPELWGCEREGLVSAADCNDWWLHFGSCRRVESDADRRPSLIRVIRVKQLILAVSTFCEIWKCRLQDAQICWKNTIDTIMPIEQEDGWEKNYDFFLFK